MRYLHSQTDTGFSHNWSFYWLFTTLTVQNHFYVMTFIAFHAVNSAGKWLLTSLSAKMYIQAVLASLVHAAVCVHDLFKLCILVASHHYENSFSPM